MPARFRSATPPSSAPAPMRPRSCKCASGSTPMPRSPARSASGPALGALIGYLSFRSGLRGSYFALVTLAFAEVFRILANASSFTGGAAGTLIKLDVGPRISSSRAARLSSGSCLGLVAIVMIATRAIERSRFGAYLVAIRENEDAAQGARRRHAEGQSPGDHPLGRDHGDGGRVLRAVFSLRRLQHRLRNLDFDRGAAGPDHRRARNGVRTR